MARLPAASPPSATSKSGVVALPVRGRPVTVTVASAPTHVAAPAAARDRVGPGRNDGQDRDGAVEVTRCIVLQVDRALSREHRVAVERARDEDDVVAGGATGLAVHEGVARDGDGAPDHDR